MLIKTKQGTRESKSSVMLITSKAHREQEQRVADQDKARHMREQ